MQCSIQYNVQHNTMHIDECIYGPVGLIAYAAVVTCDLSAAASF